MAFNLGPAGLFIQDGSVALDKDGDVATDEPMKFKINLASEPYENAGRFFLRWGALLLVLIALTGVLIYGAVLGWRNSAAKRLRSR